MTSVASFLVLVFLSNVQITSGLSEEIMQGEISGLQGVVGDVDKFFSRIPEIFASQEARPKLVYAASIIITSLLTVVIYHKRGVVTCVSILLYVMSLASMSMSIRSCYVNHDFKFPEFLTSCHLLSTVVVGATILVSKYYFSGKATKVPSLECVIKQIIPVSFTFVSSLGLANYALLYSNTHFYEMASSTTPLFTAFLAYMLGQGFDLRLTLPLVMATGGMIVVGFGEASFSVLGFLLCCGAVFLRSAKAILQNLLLKGTCDMAMDPIEVAVWSSVVSFCMMSSWASFSSGLEPFRRLMVWDTFFAVMLSCVCGSILNIAALFVLRELGPVVQQIVGQLKGIISCLGAMAVFGEVVTGKQEIGYVIVLVGIAWYNSWDMALKAQKKNDLDEKSRLLTHSKV